MLRIDNDFEVSKKLNEDFVKDVSKKLKKFEMNYKFKLQDFLDEFSEVKIKKEEADSEVQKFTNAFEAENAKNKMNSGEFVGGGHFFVSFSDVMSVLLCFFVVFFSISKIDAEKFNIFFSTWNNKKISDVDIKMPNNASLSDFELKLVGKVKELVKLGVNPETIARDDVKTVKLRFVSSNIFLSGKLKISPKGKNLIKKRLKSILKIGGIKQIKINAHTDNFSLEDNPILLKKYHNNLVFSVAQASLVSEFISTELRFPEKLIVVTGYGSNQPAKGNNSEDSFMSNQRILIEVLKDKSI